MLWPRFATARIRTALGDTPVVMIDGPRQCGKSTLVRHLAGTGRTYLTLDDPTVLAGAIRDPSAFLRGYDRVTIDEVQRAPQLLLAIKQAVDEDRRPGRFLLTGSADLLTLPTVSDSLAGRMEIVTLLPLSQAELRRTTPSSFLANAFLGKVLPPDAALTGRALVTAVVAGGYPELLRRSGPARQRAWARDYVRAIVQRDVRDIADIERLDQLPRLLRAAALLSGQLTNFTQLGASLRLDDKTTKKYVAVLEQLFLVARLESWQQNRLKRLVKTPKLHFHDSGLLSAMTGLSVDSVTRHRQRFGPLLEAFVVSEIRKLTGWTDAAWNFFHYRDKDQDEVDIIVEDERGDLIAIEVKAAATVMASDFKGLRKLTAVTGDALKVGIVLYDGNVVVPFGDRLFAAPVSCLWA